LPAEGRQIERENMASPDLIRGRWRAAACAFAAGLAAPATSSQTLAYALDEVLVTATRTEQQLADALPAATVITRGQIEASQSTGLVELLGRQAGVEFARAGGPGSQASLFLRGTNSSQTLVLLDGVRLNTALAGAAPLGGVTLDAIERIEIVRGNLSSLYGSEAIGGVVQIFTRGADRSGAEASAEAGAGDARAGSVHLSQRFAGGALALTLAARRSAPFSAIDTAAVIPGPFAPGASPDIDGNRTRSGALRAQAKLGPVEFDAGFWGNRSDTEFDSTADGPAATHDERARQQALHVSAGASLAERWRARMTLAQARDDTDNRSSEPFSFNNGRFEARNRSATLANEVQLAETLTATFVYEHLEQRGASTSYDATFAGSLTGFSRRVNSVQLGAVGSRGAHRLQLALRHDEYSDVGGATTGLIAYGHDLTSRWRASLQLATAFRAPSFNDLYFPFFGNAALSPERARSGELALRYGGADTALRIAAFRNRTRDLIVFDAAASQARNVARADIDGVELMATARIADWRLQADASVSRARDRASGERLLRRAPYALHLAASRAFGRLDGLFELTRSGARYDSDINTFARTRLAAYTVARASLSWRATEALRLHLRVENLFDERYALVDGYNTARRGLFAGLTARL
jgi:vitamin B12 transporter